MNWTSLREKLLGEMDSQIAPPKLAIPALPAVVMEFCRAADRDNASVAELAGILDRDAALVVELLKVVNSASAGVKNRVSSTKTAVSLLGGRRAKLFVLTSSAQKVSQNITSPFAPMNHFSFAAMQRAIFARRLADRLGFDAELAFAGALLQDFTVAALTAERPTQYRTLLDAMTGDAPSLATQEQKRFGWNHPLAGARLMLSWQFPDDLICLTLSHHWHDSILDNSGLNQSELVPVSLSSLLPDPLDSRPTRMDQLENHLTTRFGIEVKPFQQLVMEDLQHSGVAIEPALCWTAR